MWTCSNCGQQNEDRDSICWKCNNHSFESIGTKDTDDRSSSPPGIDIVTTQLIPGKRVVKTLGIVCGEVILGTDFISDMFADFRDVVGGRTRSYEKKLKAARLIALNNMAWEAKDAGGNAVIGVDMDYETIKDSLLLVTASGTAVLMAADKNTERRTDTL